MRLARHVEELEALIAAEQAAAAPNEARIRRLRRERRLARDRMAAAGGSGMPIWARDGLAPA